MPSGVEMPRELDVVLCKRSIDFDVERRSIQVYNIG
jgi:hypothetical protein